MTSILSELKGLKSDTVAVLSRIYTKGKPQNIGTNLHNDIVSTVENLIANLNNKGNRGVTCHILASIVISLNKTPEIEGRFYSIIDRLPSILESVSSSSEESDGFLNLLESLVQTNLDEIITRLSKILPKLINCACRLCDKDESLSFGLSVLSIFGESQLRMLLNPSSSGIRRVCLIAIDHPIYNRKSAHLLALQNSIETSENWSNNFVSYTTESIRLIQLLGLKVNIDKSIMEKAAILLPSNNKIVKLHGVRKALAVERAFSGFCLVIDEMLHTGCSSGSVAVELTNILFLLPAILTLNIDIKDNDPKGIVENESGVSPSDLKVVVVEMKVHCLRLLSALFRTQTQSLLKAASSLCRPLASVMAGKDMLSYSELSRSALECFSYAVKCFPTSIVRDAKAGVLVLIDLFQQEINFLTAVRSSVLTVADSNENETSVSVSGAAFIFEAIEALLLFSGSVLSINMREQIEICVGQGLACLCKGVITPLQSDRRMHRMISERLRENPKLQGIFLRLAYAEAFSSQREGLLSGNIPMLRKICEILLRQNGVYNNSTEAARVLLAIEMILSPASVALPSIPVAIAAKKYLLNVSNNNFAVQPLAFEKAEKNVDSYENSLNNLHENEVNVGKGSFLEAKSNGKRNRDEDEGGNEKKVQNVEKLPPFVINEKINAAFGANMNRDSVKEGKEDNDDDDDNDSLPDIDIDADPEQ